MIKMVIVSGENKYAIGDSIYDVVIAEIRQDSNNINFFDDAGNIIMSLMGGSYAVIY